MKHKTTVLVLKESHSNGGDNMKTTRYRQGAYSVHKEGSQREGTNSEGHQERLLVEGES